MSDETPKLRLRPKLSPDTPPAAQPPVSERAAPPTETSAPSSAPGQSTPPEAPPVRLRPKAPAPPPVEAVAATAVIVPDPAPPPPAANAPAEAAAGDAATGPSPASARRVRHVALGISLAGLVAFAVVGFFVYQKVGHMIKSEDETAPPVAGKKPAPAAAKQPVTPAPSTTATATPASAPAPASPAPAPAQPAPTTAPPAAPAANAEVQGWINRIRISGVRGGTAPRLLLEGRTFSIGDTVNASLGVVFAGYDASRDMIRFTDRSGLSYERRPR